MCVRCRCSVARESSNGLALCPYCATLTRIEFERGFVQLESYLGKWAEFERWLVAQAYA